jgi:hypothetical protein
VPDALTPADTVADVVRAVPGVAALHPGMFGEVATLLPRRRVVGVRVSDAAIAVHVVLLTDVPIRATAALVREAVAARFPGIPIDVTVEDIATGPRRSAGSPTPGHIPGGLP